MKKTRKARVIWVVCKRDTGCFVRCTPMSVYAINQKPPKNPFIYKDEQYVKFVEVLGKTKKG